MHVGGIHIAVEYDAWHWHAARLDEDEERDRTLLAEGWKILRIRSNTLPPNIDQLNNAMNDLVAGQCRAELVLADWGGDCVPRRRHRSRPRRPALAQSRSSIVRIDESVSACVGELDRAISTLDAETAT
jgi:hypothetical protein